ncbi:hypothetical protein F511_17147 [Dorcoceras hygrometricum]|uniref:Uncharacterized protein n=1 Tax=Dorcoceras hygrometricum TaxID=472368 RepID=A0A2Z7CBU3_9LAMI|nr:hypothetical protein F511_17147 [Dorcoceras hygrometricum]
MLRLVPDEGSVERCFVLRLDTQLLVVRRRLEDQSMVCLFVILASGRLVVQLLYFRSSDWLSSFERLLLPESSGFLAGLVVAQYKVRVELVISARRCLSSTVEGPSLSADWWSWVPSRKSGVGRGLELASRSSGPEVVIGGIRSIPRRNHDHRGVVSPPFNKSFVDDPDEVRDCSAVRNVVESIDSPSLSGVRHEGNEIPSSTDLHRARLLRISHEEAQLISQGCPWYEVKASTLRESEIPSIKDKTGISMLYEVIIPQVEA